jgi:hypothetical protein
MLKEWLNEEQIRVMLFVSSLVVLL